MHVVYVDAGKGGDSQPPLTREALRRHEESLAAEGVAPVQTWGALYDKVFAWSSGLGL